MKEKNIYYESGDKYWVFKSSKDGLYYVMKNGLTHSESKCAFDEPSLAIAYADYCQNYFTK